MLSLSHAFRQYDFCLEAVSKPPHSNKRGTRRRKMRTADRLSTKGRSCFVALVAMFGLTDCGGACPSLGRDSYPVLLQRAEAGSVAQFAPDLFTRAQEARRQALQDAERGDCQAAANYAGEADRLMTAAIAETERIERERVRAADELKAERERKEQARREWAEREAEREVVLSRDAVSSQLQATQVLQKIGESGAGASLRSAEHRAETESEREFLLKRARLTLASARAMGAGKEALYRAAQVLQRAETLPAALRVETRAASAEKAWSAALEALASARAATGSPAAEEVASLMAEAREMGLTSELSERGVTVRLPDIFDKVGSRITAGGRRVLRLATLLVRAHPHGAIGVEVDVASDSETTRRRIARERASRVVAALGENAQEKARFRGAEGVGESALSNEVRLVFAAYRPSQASKVIDQQRDGQSPER